jgi:hypothetical protein
LGEGTHVYFLSVRGLVGAKNKRVKIGLKN